MQDPLPFALGQLDRLMGFFPRVDGKATYLFTLNLALLGLTAVNFPYNGPETAMALAAGLTVLLNVFSVISLYRAFFPDTRGATIAKSMLFFGAIAAEPWEDYRKRIKSLDPADLLDDVACQIHRNAEILSAKYGCVQHATAITAFAAVAFIAFLALAAAAGVSITWKL